MLEINQISQNGGLKVIFRKEHDHFENCEELLTALDVHMQMQTHYSTFYISLFSLKIKYRIS